MVAVVCFAACTESQHSHMSSTTQHQGIVAFYPPTDLLDTLGSYLKFPWNLPSFLRASAGPRKNESMFAWFFQRVRFRALRSSCVVDGPFTVSLVLCLIVDEGGFATQG